MNCVSVLKKHFRFFCFINNVQLLKYELLWNSQQIYSNFPTLVTAGVFCHWMAVQ